MNVRQGGVLVGSVLGIAASPGAVVFYSLGAFMGPIAAATGWSRAQISFASLVFTSVLIFSIPVAGRLLDSAGVRRVLIPSVLLFALMLFAVSRARTPAQFYLAFAGLGILGAGANSLSYMRAICSWFERHRGLAIGIAQSGMGAGVLLMPLLTQKLLEHGDWRFAFASLAIIVLVVALPAALWAVDERSGARAGRPVRSSIVAEMRQPVFWKLLIAFFLLAAAVNSVALHLVPAIETAGGGRSQALLAASSFGAAMFVGRIITGVLIDRFFAPYIAAALLIATALAIEGLAWAGATSLAVMLAFIVGLSAGSDGDLLSYLIARYFGLKAFASVNSLIFAAYLVATSIFPWLVGTLAGEAGHYAWPLSLCGLLAAASAIMMLTLRRYARA